MKKLLFALLFAGACFAQTNTNIQFITTTTVGDSCTERSNPQLLIPDGTVITCQSGVRAAVGGGSGGGPAGVGVAFSTDGMAFAADADLQWDATHKGLTVGPARPVVDGFPALAITSNGFTYVQMFNVGGNGNEIDMFSSRGTLASPTASQIGDQLVSLTLPAVNAGNAWNSTTNTVEIYSQVTAADGAAADFNIAYSTTDPMQRLVSLFYQNGNTSFSHIGPLQWSFNVYAEADSTLTIEDKTYTTTHNIRAGAAQSTDLTEWQAFGGAVIARIQSDGVIRPAGYKSSDDTAGVTVTTCTGFKDGLCISGM
jgi:hypothetical protein